MRSQWWPLHVMLANAELSVEDTTKKKRKENTSYCFSHLLELWYHVSAKRYFFHFAQIQENDVYAVCNFINKKVKKHGTEGTKLTRWNIVISPLRSRRRKWQLPSMTGCTPLSALPAYHCCQVKSLFLQRFSGTKKRSVEFFWNCNIKLSV